MVEAPLFCPRCGQPMRHEGAHEHCLFCGWTTHCCEGDVALPVPGEAAPLPPAKPERKPIAKVEPRRQELRKRSAG